MKMGTMCEVCRSMTWCGRRCARAPRLGELGSGDRVEVRDLNAVKEYLAEERRRVLPAVVKDGGRDLEARVLRLEAAVARIEGIIKESSSSGKGLVEKPKALTGAERQARYRAKRRQH